MGSAEGGRLTRRQVLLAGAAGAAAAVAGCAGSLNFVLGPLPATPSPSSSPGAPSPSPSRPPDFLILLTDETRFPMHWPPEFVSRCLPSFARLARNGLTFTRAYCSASQCSPSRACLMTGAYENVNGVQLTGGTMNTPAQGVPNIATMLRAADYEVVYKGKWHLSPPVCGKETGWTEADICYLEQCYGFSQWNPPDSGTSAGGCDTRSTMGGGLADNDGRCVSGRRRPEQTCGFGESVLDFLARVAATPEDQRRPFCLFVSLSNPHDIAYFPNAYSGSGYPEPVPDLGICLPPNADDPLLAKPSIQMAFRNALLGGYLPCTPEGRSDYVNLYAYLHTVVEQQIQTVLNALDCYGLTESTIIFRTADHGELGLSHNLVEKAYCAYEEVIHVPLIVSNPRLFPQAATTSALWSHVDLAPTLAELAGAQPIGVGVSQVPVLRDPGTSVQDCVLFAFDDRYPGLDADAPASHIRALRTDRYTYAVYFTARYEEGGSTAFQVAPPFEFELYDNQNDPYQMVNLLACPSPDVGLWQSLHTRLTEKMESLGATPPCWPADPLEPCAVPSPCPDFSPCPDPPLPDPFPCVEVSPSPCPAYSPAPCADPCPSPTACPSPLFPCTTPSPFVRPGPCPGPTASPCSFTPSPCPSPSPLPTACPSP